jgi:hypothetical protein
MQKRKQLHNQSVQAFNCLCLNLLKQVETKEFCGDADAIEVVIVTLRFNNTDHQLVDHHEQRLLRAFKRDLKSTLYICDVSRSEVMRPMGRALFQQRSEQQMSCFIAPICEEGTLPLRTAQSLSSQRITNARSANSAFKATASALELETRPGCGSCDILTEWAVAHGSKCGCLEWSLLKISTTVAMCLNVLVIFI